MKNKVPIVLLILAAIGGVFFLVRWSHRHVPVASSQSATMTVILPVKGIREGSKSVVVSGLLKLPGVSSVDVSVVDETVKITYDRNVIIVLSLVETIEKLGYKSQVPTANQLQVIDFKMKIN